MIRGDVIVLCNDPYQMATKDVAKIHSPQPSVDTIKLIMEAGTLYHM